jgi:hypothetical protein
VRLSLQNFGTDGEAIAVIPIPAEKPEHQIDADLAIARHDPMIGLDEMG